MIIIKTKNKESAVQIQTWTRDIGPLESKTKRNGWTLNSTLLPSICHLHLLLHPLSPILQTNIMRRHGWQPPLHPLQVYPNFLFFFPTAFPFSNFNIFFFNFLALLSDCGYRNFQFSSTGLLHFLGAFPWKQNCRNYTHYSLFLCGNIQASISLFFSFLPRLECLKSRI